MDTIIINPKIFFEIKSKIDLSLNDELKVKINQIKTIIKNNTGFTYYDKNKHSRNKIFRGGVPKWRHEKKNIIKKVINSDIDKYNYEINSLLNKLSKKNFDQISKRILEYYTKTTDNESLNKLIDHFIDSIFTKAVVQPIYCPFYVKFLKLFNEKFNIDKLLKLKCDDFKKVIDKTTKNNKENMTKQEEYDDFCENNIKKMTKQGFSQFIGELFNNEMINETLIIQSIEFFIYNLELIINNSNEEEQIENIIICLDKIIKTTSNSLKKLDFEFNEINIKINTCYKSYNKSKRLKYKILDIVEYLEKI